MLPAQYTYLFGASLFFIPWIIIFFLRKDLRPILISIGLISMPLSLIAELYWWTSDWWQPQTITNTKVGLEDMLLSFTSVGVSATLFLTVARRQLVDIKIPSIKRMFNLIVISAACMGLFAILFQSGINSFAATLIVFFVANAILLGANYKLAIPAIINGIMTLIMVVPVFLAMFAVTPQYVEQTWKVQNLLGVYFLGIPLEDIVFYFVGGALSFGAYPYITNARLVKYREVGRD